MNADADMKVDQSDNDWVRIKSCDGFSFVAKRSVANMSETIKNSLDTSNGGGFSEAESKTYISEDRGIIVQKTLEYMAFRAYYEGPGRKEEVPIKEMLERIPPRLCLELLIAADYQET